MTRQIAAELNNKTRQQQQQQQRRQRQEHQQQSVGRIIVVSVIIELVDRDSEIGRGNCPADVSDFWAATAAK